MATLRYDLLDKVHCIITCVIDERSIVPIFNFSNCRGFREIKAADTTRTSYISKSILTRQFRRYLKIKEFAIVRKSCIQVLSFFLQKIIQFPLNFYLIVQPLSQAKKVKRSHSDVVKAQTILNFLLSLLIIFLLSNELFCRGLYLERQKINTLIISW